MGPPCTEFCCFNGLISIKFTLQSLAYHTENDSKWKFSSNFSTERGLPWKPIWCWVMIDHGAIFMLALIQKNIFQSLLYGKQKSNVKCLNIRGGDLIKKSNGWKSSDIWLSIQA